MPNELAFYLSQYGYLAIFLLVFSQEAGAPNPIPNELVLVFSGYLAFSGTLHLPFIILTALVADLLAASILFTIFYLFGNYILYKKNRWLPISESTLKKQIIRFKERGLTTIILGRLTPFVRGYVAVICGIMHIKPKKYGMIIFATSIFWGSAYVVTGYFLGPYWDFVIKHIDQFKYLLYALLLILITFMLVRFIISKLDNKTSTSLID